MWAIFSQVGWRPLPPFGYASAEHPAAARSTAAPRTREEIQEPPDTPSSRQEHPGQPGAARGYSEPQELPEAPRNRQEHQGAARSTQEHPGAASNIQKPPEAS